MVQPLSARVVGALPRVARVIGKRTAISCLFLFPSGDLFPNIHTPPTMAPPSSKDDPELGIELEPLLQSSLASDGNASDWQSTRNVISRSWRRLFLRISVCAGLSLVAIFLLLTRPREWHPSGPTVSLLPIPP